MARTARDLVHETYVEIALDAELYQAELTANIEAYRFIAQQALQQLHEAHVREQASLRRLRDLQAEIRRLRTATPTEAA